MNEMIKAERNKICSRKQTRMLFLAGVVLIVAYFFFFQFNYQNVFYDYDLEKMALASGFTAIEQRKEVAEIFEGKLSQNTLLGTPATRAAIIEKLVAAGFVERKGKNLIPTKAGINLVTVLPEPLTSPMLTAEWEQKLTEIAKGGADPDTFMDGIRTMVQRWCGAGLQ